MIKNINFKYLFKKKRKLLITIFFLTIIVFLILITKITILIIRDKEKNPIYLKSEKIYKIMPENQQVEHTDKKVYDLITKQTTINSKNNL